MSSIHSFAHLWARGHDWGMQWSKQVGFMLAICSDSPTGAEKNLKFSRFNTRKTRITLSCICRVKRDHPYRFWSMPRVAKAFVMLPRNVRESIIQEMETGIRQIFMKNLGTIKSQLRTAQGASRKQSGEEKQ